MTQIVLLPSSGDELLYINGRLSRACSLLPTTYPALLVSMTSVGLEGFAPPRYCPNPKTELLMGSEDQRDSVAIPGGAVPGSNGKPAYSPSYYNSKAGSLLLQIYLS